jgi:(S)-2-hydroxyglutarate dehydrogenase
MVQSIDPKGFTEWTKPGIRAQLLDKQKLSLVQDFVVEGDAKSIHVLNAVSPAFTCSFPFSEHLATKYVLC